MFVSLTSVSTITDLTVTDGVNNLYPSFDPSITDYCVKTGQSTGKVSYTLSTNSVSLSAPRLYVNDYLQITDDVKSYYIRFLPSYVNSISATYLSLSCVDGYYLCGLDANYGSPNAYTLYNKHGVPLWYTNDGTNAMSLQYGLSANRFVLNGDGAKKATIQVSNDYLEYKDYYAVTTYSGIAADKFVSGINGNAAAFSIAPNPPRVDYLQNTSTGFDVAYGDISYSVWINPNSYGTQGVGDDYAGAILDFRSYGSDPSGLMLFTSNGNIRIYAGGTPIYNTTQVIPLSTWTNITFSRINNTSTIYINGSADGSFTDNSYYDSTTLTVGAVIDYLGTQVLHFDGAIDEIGIWAGGLSNSDALTLYNSGSGITYPFADLGITSHWKLDDETWIDSSGNNNTLTNYNGVYTTTGIKGSAAYFDGFSDLECSVSLGTSDFTLAAWVYPTSDYSYQSSIFNQGNDDVDGAFSLFRYSNGSLAYYAWRGNDYLESSAGDVPINEWSHVALTRVDNVYTIWVNGNIVAQSELDSVGKDLFESPFKIGNGYGGIGFFTGAIDDAGVYNRALDSNEISNIMTNGINNLLPNLISYYKLDETNGVRYDSLSAYNLQNYNALGTGTTWAFDQHDVQEISAPLSRRGNIISFSYTDYANNGFYIQEQDKDHNFIWDWKSNDYLLEPVAEAYHLNSVDVHPDSGDILISARGTSSVFCIDYVTKELKWNLQGNVPTGIYGENPRGLETLANSLSTANTKWIDGAYGNIIGEPYYNGYQYSGPNAQHDARFHTDIDPLTAGNIIISMYDDQSHAPYSPAGAGPNSRGVIYEIDPVNGIAYHRSSIFSDDEVVPSNPNSPFVGSYTIIKEEDSSYSHAINFSVSNPEMVEYRGGVDGVNTQDKVLSFDVTNANAANTIYRIIKVPITNFDIEFLRHTAGQPLNTLIAPLSTEAIYSAVLQNNPLYYWKLNEVDGVRYDSITGAQIVETGGIVGNTSGIKSRAASLANGDQAWLTLPAGVCDIGSDEKSFSLWFKLGQTNAGYQWIGPMQGNGDDQTEPIVVYIEGDGTLSSLFTTNGSNWTNEMRTSIVPTANEWHHVVVTYSGTESKLYYDGEEVATSSYTDPISYTGGQYTLGHYNAFPNGLGGSYAPFARAIDELKIWNRSITPDEVLSIYKDGTKTSKYNFQKVLGIPTYTFEKVTPQSILDLPFYIKSGGAGSSKIKLYQDGLYGKRYIDYYPYNGGVNAFATLSAHGDEQATVDFYNFTSSADFYSWQWTGYFKAPYTDNFVFRVANIDDSVDLWVGDNAILGFTSENRTAGGLYMADNSSEPIHMIGGQYYPVRLQFGENDGGDHFILEYSSSYETNVTNFQGRFFHLTHQDLPISNPLVKNGSSPYNAGDSAYQIKTDFPSSTDGLYWIKNANMNGGDPFQIYADMTTDGGGWTLIAMNNNNAGWTYENAIYRNQLTPPSDPDNRNGNDYSIIAWANDLKKSSSGFQYMIDADTRRSNGGIWTANGDYDFVNNNNTQTNITLNTKFGNWVYKDNGIEEIMPWYANAHGYITTSNNAGGQYWGTLISDAWGNGVAPWIQYDSVQAESPRCIWYWVR